MQAIERAWKFVWGNKTLWVFGIFAAFLGQFGIVEFLGKLGLVTGDAGRYFEIIAVMIQQLGDIIASMAFSFESQILSYFLLTIMFVLFTTFVFIATVSQGVLIHASAQSVKNKKTDMVKSWHACTGNFWGLFFVNFFKKVFIVILSIVVSLSAYVAMSLPSMSNNIFFLGVFLLVSLMGMTISFLAVYTSAYIVVEKYSAIKALGAAWKLLYNHWLVSFEIGIIILIFNLFLGLITALGFTLFILPAILIWFAVILIGGSKLILVSGFIAGLIVFTMYLITVGAVFTVFTTHIWTYVFMKMHKIGIKSHIIHYLSFNKNASKI